MPLMTTKCSRLEQVDEEEQAEPDLPGSVPLQQGCWYAESASAVQSVMCTEVVMFQAVAS